jgi:Tfp pilus assembly ATPase PilU
MTNEQALAYMHNLLRAMLDKKASDLFISADFPPAMKIDGKNDTCHAAKAHRRTHQSLC